VDGGRRICLSAVHPLPFSFTTRVITYTYDDLYRLVDADYSTGEQFEYVYDGVGNRTVHTRTLTSTTVTTYTYDSANRLDYFYEAGVQTDLTWDDNGNLLAQGTSVYTWNAANRLVSAEVGGVVSTYAYNGLGQRTSQTVGGTTTQYVLDVAGGLPEVIVATSGGTSTYYVQVQGQILAQHGSGAWAYALPDHLGSVRQLSNAGGQVTLAQSFDPFGNLFETSGAATSAFAYTGEWYGSYNELLFLRARYYDPVVGRFLSRDLFPGNSDQPQSLNGWSYANGNPLRYVDPIGYFSEEQIMAIYGVETWNEVLALFQPGGPYEGRWGWLSILLMASVYDQFYILEETPETTFWGVHEVHLEGKILGRGRFVEIDGKIYVTMCEGSLGPSCNAPCAQWAALPTERGEAYGFGFQYMHIFDAGKVYPVRCRWDTSRVNWTDTTLDTVGTVASLLGANPVVEALQSGSKVKRGAQLIDTGLSIYGLVEAALGKDPNQLILSLGGFMPGPIGGGFNLASVVFDLDEGRYCPMPGTKPTKDYRDLGELVPTYPP